MKKVDFNKLRASHYVGRIPSTWMVVVIAICPYGRRDKKNRN
ncbi:MAG TPA: hypothetical protein VK589_06110 [Chryseolinea sp.]|nr:hypothetical protein [Chryseolinea sp.]